MVRAQLDRWFLCAADSATIVRFLLISAHNLAEGFVRGDRFDPTTML